MTEETVDPARHNEKMKKKQAARAKIMAGKTEQQGAGDRPYRHRQGQDHGGAWA